MFKTGENKIIFFEKITPGNYRVARDCLNQGHMIYFFNSDAKVNTSKFIDLSKHIFDYHLIISAGAAAHKNIDTVFGKYFVASQSIATTIKLYRLPELINMYKKELLLYLNDVYYLELKLNTMIEGTIGEVEFYPANGFDIHTDKTSLLSKRVNIINNNPVYDRLTDWYKHIRDSALLFYPIYILLKKVKWVSLNKKPAETYQIGINANLPAMFTWNYQYINYFIEPDSGIPKEKIIFIDERYNQGMQNEFKEHGFRYIDFLHGRTTISLDLLLDLMGRFLPLLCICIFQTLLEDQCISKTTRVILTDYVRWNLLANTIHIKNNVTVLLPDTISKNHILTAHGCKTWFIYPDNTTGDYHTGWDEDVRVSTVFTLMSVDTAIIFGNKVRRYFEYHRNNIKNYIPVGVISAQSVRKIREGKLKSPLTETLKEKKFPRIRIGVFDTTFADYGVLKIKDGIKFCKDILALLDDFPEVGVIFKEKKFRNFTPEVSSMYKLLEEHPRCIVVPKKETGTIFASDVIAASVLVISAAYTTTTTEAMGARTKAIYYDVVGKDNGDNFYFNRFPNFVAHDYRQLKNLVKYWLYDVTSEDFNAYLERNFKTEIDPYLDGHAIDRLKQLLMAD